MMTKRWQTVTLVVALAAVAAVVAAPAVVYAEQYRGSADSERLARAERDVHEVREKLYREEHPSLASRITGLFSGSKSSDDTASGAYESVKQAAGRAFGPEQIERALHKLKMTLGVEQPTAWEKIRRTFGIDRSESITDQLRHAFGYEPVTEEGFFKRLSHSLMGESDSTLTQARRALGLEPSTSSDWFHKLKVALGTEDPTVWERVKESIEPSWTERLLHPLTSNSQLTADHVVQRVKQSLSSLDPRHHDTVMEKVKKAIGWQPPGVVDRITGEYGTGLQETVEAGAHLTREAASAAADRANEFLSGSTYDDVMHKVKMAIGVEDPTTWESIKSALEHPQSLSDHLRHWIGAEGMHRSDLMTRLSESMAKLDPRKRETTFEKLKKAIGLDASTTADQMREMAGDKAQQLADTANKLLSGTSFDDALQKVKAALSGEDSTVWTTIQSALSSQSLPDQVRHIFGRNRGTTATDLFEKIKSAIPEMSRRDSTLDKIKKALGLQGEGFLDKLRGGVQETADYLSGDALKDLTRRAAIAIGVDDPTAWESIKSAFDSQPTLFERVKGVLGGQSGMTRESLYERVKESLSEMDPRRRDTILKKIKKAVGLQEPGVIDRVKQTFGNAEQKAEDAWDKANEVLQGSSYDEAIHQLKVMVGREDPSLWEKMENALHPRESLGQKVRHIFGRDSGMTRNTIAQRVQEALSSMDPTHRESWTTKIKTSLGLQEPTLLGRAKEKLDHILGRDSYSKGPSIEQALNAFRSSSPDNRDTAFGNLRKALEDARTEMKDKTSSLYELLGGHYDDRSGLSKAVQEIENNFHSAYDALHSTVGHWKDGLNQFVQNKGRADSSLLESTHEENGLTTHYINDNGHEFLDVVGVRADERSFDKLRELNAFRYEFNLRPHDSLPANASVQVHSTKRPHVLIKSSRFVNGDRFDYCYDDGKETLGVEWRDKNEDKTLDRELQRRMFAEFRAQYGLPPSAGDHERSHVRAQIHRFKDDL